MQLKAEGVVTGYTQFKGDIDGQTIDANTIFVEVSIGQMGKGCRSVARKCMSADVIAKVAHLPFPIHAELVMEEQATRNKEQIVVLEIRPIKVMPKAA